MNFIVEIYEYREMVSSLVRRDLRGRYKGSFFGFLWTFINPLFQLIIYTIVFSYFMKMGIDKFYMFLFVALVPWIFFNSCLQMGATCVIDNKEMVKKIYFPRMVLPLSYVLSNFINMLFCFVVIFAVIFVTGFGVNIVALLYLPITMLVELILAIGIILITSACTVFVRDLQHVLSIVGLGWMYLTPVIYPESMIPDDFRIIFQLNPMLPIVRAYRDILYYKRQPQISTLLQAALMGIALVIVGIIVFNHLQKKFVEEL
ncbi:MAG: ABC transporter permease [Lachnospiraceae bacterium]|nr:ABC transporter permease [Lachnospiraceae bacterium]